MDSSPTTRHTPGVDYRATSVRIRFADLSPEVRRAADLALGSPVVEAAPPVTSGFTNAYAGRVLLSDGRHAFLKATGPDFPFPVKGLRREAQMLTALDGQIPGVPMIGAAASEDGGQVLALQWLDGHMPGFPWGGEDVGLVREACERIAEVPTSSLEGLEPAQMATEFVDEQLQASLAGGLRLPSSLHGLPAWLPGRVEEVLAIASRTAELLQGAHLNHHDLRPDNLLVGHPAGEATVRAYVLDWSCVSLGPAWCDWVGLLPTMHSQGHDLTRLLDSTPLSRQAPPEAIDTWLAIVAVYMLENLDKPPPGSMSALRDHQRFFAAIFLASLAEHRGWRCPALKG